MTINLGVVEDAYGLLDRRRGRYPFPRRFYNTSAPARGNRRGSIHRTPEAAIRDWGSKMGLPPDVTVGRRTR